MKTAPFESSNIARGRCKEQRYIWKTFDLVLVFPGIHFLLRVPEVIEAVKVEQINQLLQRSKTLSCSIYCVYLCLECEITEENWRPRTVFPISSRGGDQRAMDMTLGTTIMRQPLTPDLAGSPTWKIAQFQVLF